jgi:uncharacterized protein (DUF433 family)
VTTLETTHNAPLHLTEDGTIRIKGSRVMLDSIVHHFKLGATAEQIQDSFPSLSLREIYGAITYYLEHEGTVEEYLRQQTEEAQETRRFVESRTDTTALRARISARRNELLKR